MSLLSLVEVVELSDLQSLEENKLQPKAKLIHSKTITKLSSGAAIAMYYFDEDQKEVLFVMDDSKGTPLVLILQLEENLPPSSVQEWQQSNPFVFDNPAETNVNRLFMVKEITNPDGKLFIRILPVIEQKENPDSVHLLNGTGIAVSSDPTTTKYGKLTAAITLYETTAANYTERFIVLVNLKNEVNQKNGGLLYFYKARQVQPSEIS